MSGLQCLASTQCAPCYALRSKESNPGPVGLFPRDFVASRSALSTSRSRRSPRHHVAAVDSQARHQYRHSRIRKKYSLRNTYRPIVVYDTTAKYWIKSWLLTHWPLNLPRRVVVD